MSKHIRKTEPQETLLGLLVSYEDIEPLLLEGEANGRSWILDKALSYWQDEPQQLAPAPSDQDIYELHKEMFKDIFEWAGTPRIKNKGPGGIIHVEFYNVRQELKTRFENLQFLTSSRDFESVDLDFTAEFVAKAHHDFEFVHPFTDTNGRTGRTLDHYILWYTLGLVGSDLHTSPQIQYFPNEDYEKQYSTALSAADNYNLSLLIDFYKDRISAALEVAEQG